MYTVIAKVTLTLHSNRNCNAKCGTDSNCSQKQQYQQQINTVTERVTKILLEISHSNDKSNRKFTVTKTLTVTKKVTVILHSKSKSSSNFTQ